MNLSNTRLEEIKKGKLEIITKADYLAFKNDGYVADWTYASAAWEENSKECQKRLKKFADSGGKYNIRKSSIAGHGIID